MAFAALNGLNEAIRFLQYSYRASASILSCPEIPSVQDEIVSFQELLQSTPHFQSRGDGEVIGDLDGQAQEAAFKLQDVIEETFGGHQKDTSEQTTVIKQEIDSFIQEVKMIKEQYAARLQQLIDNEEGGNFSPRTDLDSITSEMIGLEDEFIRIRNSLMDTNSFIGAYVFSILGMAGIGKTALAKRIYQDPLVKEHFQICAIVSIGPKYEFRQVIKVILAQMLTSHPDIDRINSEKVLSLCMRKRLKGRRYLIVLDDVWDREFMTKFTHMCLPKNSNGSQVLVTTRTSDVTSDMIRLVNIPIKIRFLNEEEGWNLFLEKVFGNEPCPPNLWKVGKKIVENCDGLPLTIIGIAELLSKAEKTLEYWESVTKNPNPLSIGEDDQTEITQTLLLSYKHLPKYLKPCFLYMAVFLPNSDVPFSRLTNLWSVEGFLGPDVVVMDYLKELISSSVVLVSKANLDIESDFSVIPYHLFSAVASMFPQVTFTSSLMERCFESALEKCGIGQGRFLSADIKTYKIHSAYWHVCVSEARKHKLFHVLNSFASTCAPWIETQRRLNVQNNVLFGIKEVRDSIASLSNTHSLLCTGPHHKYPIPICFSGLRLLRVLDALTIHFYVFPVEVLKLILLRYLSLTCNDNLPASISQLWNLQFLIVHQHFNIKSTKTWSYLPVEIWDLKELRHLQVMGSDLPDPPPGSSLPNLIVLLDVSPRSCTHQVLTGIPKLEELGIQIDLAPSEPDSSLLFNLFACLSKLRSLKCIVTNPHNSGLQSVALPPSLKMLPENLRELTLSGLRYDWKYVNTMGELPNLGVLTLQCNAFQGYKWKTRRNHFRRLSILTLEDMDLVQWEAEPGCFTELNSLIVKHCYKLECIPLLSITNAYFLNIGLFDAQPSTVLSLLETRQRRSRQCGVCPVVQVHSSWNNQTQVMHSDRATNHFDLEKYVAMR